MIKTEFAKIGKHIARQLSGAVEHYIFHEEEVIEDILVGEPFTYESAPNKKISTIHTRLSKAQIAQFLLYHFYQVDERGVIRDIPEKDVAEELGCTIKTVRNNNVIFEQLGMIYYSRSSNGFNIKLVEYPNYFEKLGTGYIELSFERFEELIQIENVNALRLEIRKELVYDNNEAKRKYKHDYSPSKISFHDFKTFTPKYTHYRGMLEVITNKGTNTFKTVVKDDNTLYFTLEDGMCSSKDLKVKKKENYTNAITDYLNEHKISGYLTKIDINDFVQLALEYTLNRVFKALDTLINLEFVLGLEVTRNYGGRLRTIIRQQLNGEETVTLIS